MEDAAARQPQGVLEVAGRLRLDASVARAVGHDDRLDGLGEHRVQRVEHRPLEGRAHSVVGLVGQQSVGGVQSEDRERVGSGRAQFGAQDARVGEGVAVDLRRDRLGHPAGARRVERALQLREGLVDVEGAAEGRLRAHRVVEQARQAVQQEVDLDLGALGAGQSREGTRARSTRRQQALEVVGRDIHEHMAGSNRARGRLPALVRHRVGDLAIGGQCRDVGARDGLGAGHARGSRELVRDGTHAADRHIPVTRTAADHVVQEAPVREQRLIDVGGEGADEGVGVGDTAHEVVREGVGDGLADRLLDEAVPQVVVADRGSRLTARQQWLGHGREERAGQASGARGELAPRDRIGLRAEPGEARGHARGILVVDEEAAVRRTGGGRVGAVAPRGEADAQPQVVDDALRQEAHEVAVAAQARVDAGKGLGRDRRATENVEPLEHEHVEARLGKVGGRREAVVPAADDDHVPSLRHAVTLALQRAPVRVRRGRGRGRAARAPRRSRVGRLPPCGWT